MEDPALIEGEIGRFVDNGQIDAALEHYRRRLDGFEGVGWRLGDYRLGLRVTERLAAAGGVLLEGYFSVRPWYDRALYHLALGDLAVAEEQLKLLDADLAREKDEVTALVANRDDPDYDWVEHYEELISRRTALGISGRLSLTVVDTHYRPSLLQSLCDVMLAQGRLSEAERYAQLAMDTALAGADAVSAPFPLPPGFYGRRAAARFLLGKVNDAWNDLDEAERSAPISDPLGGMERCYRLQYLLRQGKLQSAAHLLDAIDWAAAREECPMLWAQYALCQVELFLARREGEQAPLLLEQAVAWAERSGHQETWIRAMLDSARRQMQQNDALEAGRILQEVQTAARSKGYRLWLIECLLLQGHCCLLLENLAGAEEAAREAIALSDAAETEYAWGTGSGSHLLAELRFRQGRIEEARPFAQRACTVRTALEDARLPNSQALLEKIGAG